MISSTAYNRVLISLPISESAKQNNNNHDDARRIFNHIGRALPVQSLKMSFKVFEAGKKTGDKTSLEEVHQLMRNLCTPKDSGQFWKSSLSERHYHIASSGIYP